MSTRCLIGVARRVGSGWFPPIDYIYCHNDGYPSYVGEALEAFYNTHEKAERLLALGDLSSIGVEPVPFADNAEYERDLVERVRRHVKYPAKCSSSAVTDGRGMEGNAAHHTNHCGSFVQEADGSIEYLYMLTGDGTWNVWDTGRPWRGWILVPECTE